MNKAARIGTVVLALCSFLHAATSVSDAGAVGDGTTDCTAAFQKAMDKMAAAGGGVVDVPAGQWRIEGSLRIPAQVTLQGTYRTAPTDHRDDQGRYKGSVLLAYGGRGKADGAPLINLSARTATIAGLVIHYPERKVTDVPPVPYPPAIFANGGDNAAVLDCLIVNPYEAIHFDGAARFLIRNVHGYPDYRGLFVDACYDIGRVENVHFWPFGIAYSPKNPYCEWINTHAVAFEFARTDWQYVTNTFCFGYGVGYKFSKTKAGACNGNFLGIGADCCRRAILVEACQYPGLLITNGELVGRWGGKDSVCVEIAEQSGDGKVSLVNTSIWGPMDRCIWARSRQTQFTATGSHFCDWDNTGSGSPAIQIDAGRAIIQGNTFRQGETHVRIGPRVRSAIIMGNQAANGLTVINEAGARTQCVANETSELDAMPESMRASYMVDVGAPGDEPFIRRSYGHDRMAHGPDDTMRWATGDTRLHLPVVRNERCTVELDIHLPAAAVAPDNGLYLGDKKLAPLPDKAYDGTIKATVPPNKDGRVTLTLHVKTWRPSEVIAGSADTRELALALFSVTVRAEGATFQPTTANAD